jgi:hypothetical protein
MTTCYKCGKITANNSSECDECESGGPNPMRTLAEQLLERSFRTFEIDYDRVRTVADLVIIISNIFRTVTLTPNFVIPEELKPFLKPILRPPDATPED